MGMDLTPIGNDVAKPGFVAKHKTVIIVAGAASTGGILGWFGHKYAMRKVLAQMAADREAQIAAEAQRVHAVG